MNIAIEKNPTPFFATMVELTITKKVRIEFMVNGELHAQTNTQTLCKEDGEICWANEFGALSQPTQGELDFISIALNLAPNCWILPAPPEMPDNDLWC